MEANKPLVMADYKSFAVTVQGGSHIKSGDVCQDASNCFDNESVSIAVVADGHGESSCFRSDEGARLAVNAAKNGIWQFVKENEELFESGVFKRFNPPSHKELEKLIREKLIRQTVAKWNKDVMEHHQEHPFTEQELEKVSSEKYRLRYGKDKPEYEDGRYVNKAYGTSLIAAAITPWYWFSFHVGDGRFSVLYEDSSGAQPVPWDPKCYLNVTTLICDEDILEWRKGKNGEEGEYVFRAFLSLHSEKEPPVAFFCCSDGIDDNYPTDEKENAECLYRLYREIAVTAVDDGYESTFGQDGKSGQLKDLANGFAIKGKGDDTSLAGILNIKKLKEVAPLWKERMAADEAERKKAEASAKEKNKAETEAREKAAEELAAKKEARRAEREAENVKAEAEKTVTPNPSEENAEEKSKAEIVQDAKKAIDEAAKKIDLLI